MVFFVLVIGVIMMRVIVCVKYVPEVIIQNYDGCSIKRDNVLGNINPADMFAIEEGIRIKEHFNAETFGLCMGVMSAEASLKNAIALGLDKMFLMSDKCFSGSDTLATSYVLSKGLEYISDYDLVLCGRQSTDSDTGQVAQEIASHLDLPCLINVVAIEFIESKKIKCKILTEYGYSLYEIHLPAVLSVSKGINVPRIPTISGLQRAQSTKIQIIDSEAAKTDPQKCGLLGSPTKVKNVRQHKYNVKNPKDITLNFKEVFFDLIVKRKFNLSNDSHTNKIEIDCSIMSNVRSDYEIWVVCEITYGCIAEVSLQLLSKAAQLAKEINGIVAAIVFCENVYQYSETFSNYGVKKIYYSEITLKSTLFDETLLLLLTNACRKHVPSVVLFGNTTWGRWIAPIVAVKLRTGLTADCFDLHLDTETNNLIQTRLAFCGNLIADIICPNTRPQMATVRCNVFHKNSFINKTTFELIDIGSLELDYKRINVVGQVDNLIQSTRLMDAEVVIAGGKGVGNKENFLLLFKLAELLNGAVAATRYAVDAGWVDYSYQVGQTGISVKPKLYIAFGISGAIEHVIGMRDSDCIISVNVDADASIFDISDYKIIDSCDKVLNSLISCFSYEKGDRLI